MAPKAKKTQADTSGDVAMTDAPSAAAAGGAALIGQKVAFAPGTPADERKRLTDFLEANGAITFDRGIPSATMWVVATQEQVDEPAATLKTAINKGVVKVVKFELFEAAVKAGGMDRVKAADYELKADQKKKEEEEEKPAAKGRKRLADKQGAPKDDEASPSAAAAGVDPAPKKRTRGAKVVDKQEEEEEEEVKPKAKAKAKNRAKEEEDKAPPTPAKAKQEEEVTEAKMVSAVVKGGVPVDAFFPQKAHYHVYRNGREVWDAMLNQTNVGSNNNKFYVIQLLEADKGGSYITWTRWGRVGANGQNASFGPYSSVEQAKDAFLSKFKDKSGNNHWYGNPSDTVKNYTKKAGKYDLLEMDYSLDDKAGGAAASGGGADGKEKKPPKKSNLHPKVQDIVELICDVRMMSQAMMEIGYDAKKMPLGKLSKAMIKKGYETLKDIETELKGGKRRNVLLDLSSQFYTTIPHDFGFRNMREFTIDSMEELKKKLAMLEALGEIEIATKLMGPAGDEDEEHPADAHYKKLKTDFQPVDDSSETFKLVEEYMRNTHGATHTQFSLKLNNLFEVAREGEANRYKPHAKDGNRMLLWHGSRLTNFVGILSQGLRIAPPEAPVTGYMFGKGVYFADMVSKSAQYCFASKTHPRAVMLLCEVALGEHNELLGADYNASNLPKGKLSTKGCGQNAPDPKGFKQLPDGVTVPCGKATGQNLKGSSLLYNEFIVYDVAQIKIRYLLEVEFDYKY